MYVCRYCRYYRYPPGVWGWRCSPSSSRSRAPAGTLAAGTTPATLGKYFSIQYFWFRVVGFREYTKLVKSDSLNLDSLCPNLPINAINASGDYQLQPFTKVTDPFSLSLTSSLQRYQIVEPRLLLCYQLVSGWKYKCCTIATEFRVEKTWRENRF